MKTHEFTVVLTKSLTENQIDPLYGSVDDGGYCERLGVAMVQFDRDAASLEDAIRSAVADLQLADLEIERVEIEKESFLEPAAA